ncbi:hypothetical protein AVEN_197256-1 [Araneus ventricosus]|uniref:Uncharacterized protein n=1 Tax=Araneus ventricosus TaxID=182803 RepID=A0A4Y2LMP4_ARAVE|nr:hypothetical protein AVEN_197256-1 [Araneus ventricosus]
MPKQQIGNTNDFNTALVSFFSNAEKSAEIIAVNVELIKRFHVMSECIKSGFFINSESFYEYLKETRELYIREYSWYSMPVSVHKILLNGKYIIDSCILLIDPFIANLGTRPKTKSGKISNEVRELLELRALAPIDQDVILSESSDTEESESVLEESDLDSK